MPKKPKERNEMIDFARAIADEIIAKHPGDGSYIVLDLVREIMLASDYCQKRVS